MSSLCPPSPAHPQPPAALTSTSCSVKATLQKEKCCQGWRHHGDCMLKMPLVRSQGCQPPPEVGSHVPLAWRAALVQWKRRKVQPLDDTVPWDPPVRQTLEGHWSYLCKPSLSSTESSLGKLSSDSSGVSASAGRQ